MPSTLESKSESSPTPTPHSPPSQSSTHILTLQPRYFSLIASGQKTVEGRLATPKYLAIRPGDTIIFYRNLEHDPKADSTNTTILAPSLVKESDVVGDDENEHVSEEKNDSLPASLTKGTSDNQITRTVKAVQHFTSFRDMLQGCGLKACLPGVEDVDTGVEVYRAIADGM